MRDMGVTVSRKGLDTYSFKAEKLDLSYLESDEFLKKCSSLRGSVMLIGPMVARFHKAMISKPGGDKITLSAYRIWVQISRTIQNAKRTRFQLAN